MAFGPVSSVLHAVQQETVREREASGNEPPVRLVQPERGGSPGCEHERMSVARLVTLLEARDDGTDPRTMSVSARHEAVLTDGRRILLLADRGWTSSLNRMPSEDTGIWAETSIEEIEQTARTVVGPDEPYAGRSREDMEAGHWGSLADVLRDQGVVVDARELQRLPHDVVLSERLLARTRAEAP